MRRARAAALPIVRPDLVESYLAHRAAQGMNTDHKVRWGARALLAAVPDLADFCRLPLDRQLAFNHETHRFISWLAVTGRMQPGADYLVARRPRLGIVLARTEPELHLRFIETARTLGFRDALAMTQFNLLGHFVALFGKPPDQLQQSDWDEGRLLLLEASRRIPNRGVKALSTALFNLEATLFHCELTDQLPRRRSPDRADVRAQEWAQVPAGMTDTMQHYLRQIASTLRPGTVKNAELTLREFALLVSTEDTAVTCVAQLKQPARRTLPAMAARAAGRPRRTTAPAHRPRPPQQAPWLLPCGWMSGMPPTGRPASWCSTATSRSRTSRCLASSTTPQRPNCWPPPARIPIRSPGWPSRSSPAPGCAAARCSASPSTRSCRSAPPTGSASRSARCTPTATFPCIRS